MHPLAGGGDGRVSWPAAGERVRGGGAAAAAAQKLLAQQRHEGPAQNYIILYILYVFSVHIIMVVYSRSLYNHTISFVDAGWYRIRLSYLYYIIIIISVLLDYHICIILSYLYYWIIISVLHYHTRVQSKTTRAAATWPAPAVDNIGAQRAAFPNRCHRIIPRGTSPYLHIHLYI